MKLPTLLCVVTFTVSIVSIESVEVQKLMPRCDALNGLDVQGTFLEKEVLAQGLNRPYQLSFHKKKQEIFFSNNVGNDTEDKFEIRRLRVHHNRKEKVITEVENGFATAVDEENQIAYFGGSSGIYKMNLEEEKITKILEEHNIWDMFFKKHLYFITYPSQKLYKLTVKDVESDHKSGKGKKHHKHEGKEEEHIAEHEKWIHEKIYQFAIDGDNDTFITNKTGLFIIKNGTEHRIHIPGETVFRAIEINHKGEAYFVGKNGIYVVKKHEHTLHEIAHVKNIFGLTFDSDGLIIYSSPLQIINLLPSECKMAKGIASDVARVGPPPK